MAEVDARWMREALAESRSAWGRTSPNPMVGCVIVGAGGEELGRGYHHRAGLPHAEIEALRDAAARGASVRGATMYVTLEPCAFTGRTPPCADACVAAGVGRVVIGAVDPHPKVSGAGIQRLRDAGIEVVVGVEEEACRVQNAPFFTRILRGRPHVTAKVAMSLDGRLATRSGASFPLTGEAARARVHLLRDRLDAVLVGGGTARLDNPRLTCRLPADAGAEGGPRDPIRVVVDTHLKLPLTHHVMQLRASGASPAPTWLVAAEHADPGAAHLAALEQLGVEVLRVPALPRGGVDPAAMLAALAERGVNSLLAEGGGALLGSLYDARLIDAWIAHVAPRIIGGDGATSPLGGLGAQGMEEIRSTGPLRVRALGPDLEIAAAVEGDVHGID